MLRWGLQLMHGWLHMMTTLGPLLAPVEQVVRVVMLVLAEAVVELLLLNQAPQLRHPLQRVEVADWMAVLGPVVQHQVW